MKYLIYLYMFGKKYTISLINSKWEYIKSNVNITILPRIDEYLYLNEQYYQVVNVVHRLGKKQEIFVVLTEIGYREGQNEK